MTGGRHLYLLGGGGHATVVADLARSLGWSIAGIVDPRLSVGTPCLDSEVVSFDQVLQRGQAGTVGAFVAIGENEARVREYHRLVEEGVDVPPLSHPSAVVSPDVVVEGGACVMAGAVLQAGTSIGAAVVVNTRAGVDHDCAIGEGAFIGPGATLCGNVSVGAGAFVGAGATIVPGVRIGPGAFVGAGTVIVSDLGAGDQAKHWRRDTGASRVV